MLFSHFLKGRTFLFILISNPRCVGVKIIASLVTVQEHAVIDKSYLAITTALRISPKFVSLKGLSHEIDFKNFDKKFTEPGLTKGRSWFLNFLEAPMIL
jgi:hypothetical protein